MNDTYPDGYDSTAKYFVSSASGPAWYATDDDTDVQQFDFELSGQTLLDGYTEMTATAKDNCDWDVKARSFSLVDTGSSLSDALSILASASED